MPEIMFPFEVQPSSLVVFEGLDNTGKTTLHQKLKKAAHPPADEEALFAEPAPYFTHQPSGGSSVIGKAIYKLTEQARDHDLSPKSRQMLHLASHFQHYDHDIIPRLESGRSVFMDRNYWSTFAYGYFGCFDELFSPDEFYQLVRMPLRDYEPDLVFFFQHVWDSDHHNTPEVVKGYQYLAEMERLRTVVVPPGTVDETVMFVFRTLRERGITKVWK